MIIGISLTDVSPHPADLSGGRLVAVFGEELDAAVISICGVSMGEHGVPAVHPLEMVVATPLGEQRVPVQITLDLLDLEAAVRELRAAATRDEQRRQRNAELAADHAATAEIERLRTTATRANTKVDELLSEIVIRDAELADLRDRLAEAQRRAGDPPEADTIDIPPSAPPAPANGEKAASDAA